MDWQGGRRSDNVDDERGGGGGFGRPLAVGGGVVASLIGLVFYLVTGQNLNLSGRDDRPAPPVQQRSARGPSAQDGDASPDRAKEFVQVVLGSTEDTWPRILAPLNRRYVDPRLVLFDDAVQSACGFEESAVGPFYCPLDQRVYLDLSFFKQLAHMGAPGQFAAAYVIAHEVGHHVQDLLGITEKVTRLRRGLGRTDANELSVMVELQADCFAGVWAAHANEQRKLIEPGETKQGLAAAAAVGDDRLQRQARGYVVPESFTHGSSADRMKWFERGLRGGQVDSCDTFHEAGVRL